MKLHWIFSPVEDHQTGTIHICETDADLETFCHIQAPDGPYDLPVYNHYYDIPVRKICMECAHVWVQKEVPFAKIVDCALGIAKQQRQEDTLQPVDVLQRKLLAEIEESQKEIEDSPAWYAELADILYYAGCLAYYYGGLLDPYFLILAERANLDRIVVAWEAKYALRYQGTKDKVAENKAIAEALHGN